MAQSFADYPNISNPECVWTPLREWGGLPNVKWCEETLCGVIAEPANTWSNLAYLVVAVALWWFTRKDKERTLRFWAPVAFWSRSRKPWRSAPSLARPNVLWALSGSLQPDSPTSKLMGVSSIQGREVRMRTDWPQP